MSREYDILRWFGERVRVERLNRKLSQEELAARAGLHRTYVGMIERAEKNITPKNIAKICDALDISIGKFFNDKSHQADSSE